MNMRRVLNAVTIIGVALLASLLLFPPFAVIDLAAAQPRHAALCAASTTFACQRRLFLPVQVGEGVSVAT